MAVPTGSVAASGQVAWMAAVGACLEGLRADTQVTALGVARVLSDGADWSTMISRPGHEAIARRVGCSVRTVARVRVLLEAAGLVGIVTRGVTQDVLDPEAGPLAQCYILTVPQALAMVPDPEAVPGREAGDQDELVATTDATTLPPGPAVDEHVRPSQPLFWGLGEKPPHAGTREDASALRAGDETEDRPDQKSGKIVWSGRARPVTRVERRLAAEQAWISDPVLRRVSIAHVAALCREWHLAGWTLNDVLAGLNTRPDGNPWPHSLIAADVVHVPGWVRYRLTAWRTDPTDPASPPALSRSQRTAQARATAAAEHAATAAADAATRAAAVAPTTAVPAWPALRATQAITARAAAAASRRPTPPPTPPPATPPAAPRPLSAAPSSGTAAARPTPAGRRRPGLATLEATTDPRIAALRAAARARRTPRP